MKRIELFEFEDFSWFPDTIRTGATNLIVVLHKFIGTAEVLSDLILKIRSKNKFSQIIDLGSGSGGAMLETLRQVNLKSPNDPINLILSDLYPNTALVESINSKQIPNVSYTKESINATNLDATPAGLKTMIASFHHMPPATATKILASAQNSKTPILIYEIAKNNIPTWLWWLLLPLSLVILIIMSLVLTLFVRPLTFKQLFFTYIIPIIPLVYAWDGQASLVRTYTFEDIEILKQNLAKTDIYSWETADAMKSNGKVAGYYIIGNPI